MSTSHCTSAAVKLRGISAASRNAYGQQQSLFPLLLCFFSLLFVVCCLVSFVLLFFFALYLLVAVAQPLPRKRTTADAGADKTLHCTTFQCGGLQAADSADKLTSLKRSSTNSGMLATFTSLTLLLSGSLTLLLLLSYVLRGCSTALSPLFESLRMSALAALVPSSPSSASPV